MIHVIESKPTKRYGDYFMRQVVKVAPPLNFVFLVIFKFFKSILCDMVILYIFVVIYLFISFQLEGLMNDMDRVKLDWVAFLFWRMIWTG